MLGVVVVSRSPPGRFSYGKGVVVADCFNSFPGKKPKTTTKKTPLFAVLVMCFL